MRARINVMISRLQLNGDETQQLDRCDSEREAADVTSAK
jgi:hypothetical protein